MASSSGQYRLIDTPNGEPAADVAFLRAGHKIDYAVHPAYAEFARTAGLGDRLRALALFGRSFLPLLGKRLIRYEMIPFDVRQKGGLAFAAAATRNALRLDAPAGHREARSELSAALDANGVGVVAMPEASFGSLEKAAAGHFDQLVARRGKGGNRPRAFEEARSNASRAEDSALYSEVERVFAESGVLDAASQYLGRQARLVDVNPQINDRSDSFWRNIFPDADGQPLPQSAYYHRDASGGDLKAIIYMSDVPSEAHGAFTYVLGSNRATAQKLDDLICEANDHGLSATDPETRRMFAALPAKLRQKGSFGNDVPDGTGIAKTIAEASWAITSDKGSIVLFDTKGVHRGGMVETGERRVITCVLG